MRTKTLLITVALGAAGIASSIAQPAPVYSQNVVGYVNVQAPAGFSLIANPLDNKTGNNLNTILPTVPLGTTVYKYDGATGFSSSVNFGTWAPDLTLAPGEGAFIQLASATTLTFVGEVTLGAASNHQVPAGFSIQASSVPQSDKLETLQFPAELGDTVYFYRAGAYVSSAFFGTWVPDAIPAVGEGFFVNKGTAATWTRNFAIP